MWSLQCVSSRLLQDLISFMFLPLIPFALGKGSGGASAKLRGGAQPALVPGSGVPPA